MGDVIRLGGKRPEVQPGMAALLDATAKLNAQPAPTDDRWISGSAFCIGCKHTWVAVAQAGAEWLCCPECQRDTGRLKYTAVLPESAQIWECNCGNQLFKLSRDGWLCPNCGVYQSFPKPGE